MNISPVQSHEYTQNKLGNRTSFGQFYLGKNFVNYSKMFNIPATNYTFVNTLDTTGLAKQFLKKFITVTQNDLFYKSTYGYAEGHLYNVCKQYALEHFPEKIAYKSLREIIENEKIKSLIEKRHKQTESEITKIFRQYGSDFDFYIEKGDIYGGEWNTNIDISLPGIGHIQQLFGLNSFNNKQVQNKVIDTIRNISRNPKAYYDNGSSFARIRLYENAGGLDKNGTDKHSVVVEKILAKRDEINAEAITELEEILPTIAEGMKKYKP